MITVSSAFLDAMYNQDRRSFIYTVGIALADGTSMTLTNEDLFDGGISIEESVSEDSMLQIGSAIINKCTVVLQNFDGRYNYYDFQNARVVVYIGLNIDGTVESFQKGTYIVDEQDFNNSLLTLTCLDNMSLFERTYSDSALAYPASMLEIVKDACIACGVAMATDDFPCCHLIAPVRPTSQGVTFRDVISWAAQCCGCNASIDNLGRLKIGYYNFDFLDSITDELLETGTGEVELTDENDAVLTTESGENIILDVYGFNIFKSLYTINVGYNDATISGVRVCTENPESTGGDDAILEYTSGTESYELLIENNELINTTNAQEIADAIGNRLIGATYRKANFTHLSDPTVAAGNIAVIYDGHGNAYRIIISSTTFTAGDRQNTVSAGSNPPRIPDQPPQYTMVVRTTEDGYERSTQDGSVRSTGYATQTVQARSLLRAGANSSSNYNAVRRYSEQTKSLIRQAKAIGKLGGLYATDVEATGGGVVHYLHNKQNLSDSNIRLVISDSGIHATDQALSDNPEWYGMEVDGTFIANILATHGINAEWIQTGAFVIYDDDYNPIFVADKDGGVFYWNMTHSRLSSDGFLTLYADDEENAVGLRVAKVDSEGDTSLDQSIEIGADGIHASGFLSTEYEYAFDFTVTDPPMIKFTANDSNGDPHSLMINLDTYVGDTESFAPGIWWDGCSLTTPVVASIDAPGTLSNFTRGSNWAANVSRAGCTVVLEFYFDGRFTATSATAITLFTLAEAYRPTRVIRLMRMTQGGTRYILTINTNGTVTIANASGASMSSNSYFADSVTWVRSD